MTGEDCVTRREFDKLERIVQQQADNMQSLQVENAEFRVTIKGMDEAIRTLDRKFDKSFQSLELKIDMINKSSTDNKVSIAKIIALTTPLSAAITYAFTRLLFK